MEERRAISIIPPAFLHPPPACKAHVHLAQGELNNWFNGPRDLRRSSLTWFRMTRVKKLITWPRLPPPSSWNCNHQLIYKLALMHFTGSTVWCLGAGGQHTLIGAAAARSFFHPSEKFSSGSRALPLSRTWSIFPYRTVPLQQHKSDPTELPHLSASRP